MSRKRSPYRPRTVDRDPVGLAMTQAAALTPGQREAVISPALTALARLRSWAATEADWLALADMCNVAQALAALRIVSDHDDDFAAAQQALRTMHERTERGQALVATPLERAALHQAQVLHEIQLEHCSQAELQRAIDRVTRVVQAALAGNASPGTTLCGPGLLTSSTSTTP